MNLPGTVIDYHQSALWETAAAEFSNDREYRYTLTRTWDPERPPVCWVMLNPSTADAFKPDPTITRCVDFTQRWGAGGMVVLNLFALRSTKPEALYQHAEPVGPMNDDVICLRSQTHPAMLTVAAWGTHGAHNGRDGAVVKLLQDQGVQLHCLGVTKDGHPKHPLYVPAVTPLTPYTPEDQ